MEVIKTFVIICAVLAISFITIYSRSPWRSTLVGWLLMADGACLAIILSIQSYGIFEHHVPLWLQGLAMLLLTCVLTWRIIVVIMAQRDGKRDDHETR
jgi:hypothetical protein